MTNPYLDEEYRLRVMREAGRELAVRYESVAHVVPETHPDLGQICVVCGHEVAGFADTHFERGVVFQTVERSTGRTTGHVAAGESRPLAADSNLELLPARESFELWEGERWCDVQESAGAAS